VNVGTDAALVRLVRIVDGDTLSVIREQLVGATDDVDVIARDRAPVKLRLAVVDTPERSDPEPWAAARADLTWWLATAPLEVLRVRSYARDSFGRLLADVYRSDTQETASSYLLSRGWAVWS